MGHDRDRNKPALDANADGYLDTCVNPSVNCPAELDNGEGGGVPDAGVDGNDLVFFLIGYEAGSSVVDLDDGSGTGTLDGGVDVNDLTYFLIHFEARC